MKMQLEQLENTKQAKEVRTSYMQSFSKSQEKVEKNGSYIHVNLEESRQGQNVLMTKDAPKKDVLGEIASRDVKTMQNYMTVMANTLSDEDYKKLSENGFHPADMSVEETVTVMDEIKATMAEAGIIIKGYNDQLDVAKLQKITGNAGYAQVIANEFSNYHVKDTEENVKACMGQIDALSKVETFSDASKKYILENQLELTGENIYKAAYGVSKQGYKAAEGYFVQENGYYSKKAQEIDLVSIEDQIEKVIKQSGQKVDETTKSEAKWLLEQGLALTKDNIGMLHEMNQISFPLSAQVIAQASAKAISDGKRPEQAKYLDKPTDLEKAIQIKEQTDSIDEKALIYAFKENLQVQIFTLSEISKENKLKESDLRIEDNTQITTKPAYITAKRQLEEIRLKMTVTANYQLLKRGFSLDTQPLEKVVDALKWQEEQNNAVLFGDRKNVDKNQSNYSLFVESQTKLSSLRVMPAVMVGRELSNIENGSITINHLHEKGTQILQHLTQAQEKYETLMTAPRKDLGDLITKAFANVDDMLKELGQEVSEENQKAVRVLGYNQMPINVENIDKIKKAHHRVTNLIHQMSPRNVLDMIRDGINPLRSSLSDLENYLSKKESSVEENLEKYSKFLLKLEQDKSINESEREAYIGIYRMLHQIQKRDGAAIGRVITDQKEMSFENLLSAVRTKKIGKVDRLVEKETGFARIDRQNEKTISDQINDFFSALDNKEGENLYENQEAQAIRQNLNIPEKYVEQLLSLGEEITPDSLAAQKERKENRNRFFEKMNASAGEAVIKKASDTLLEAFTDMENAKEAYEKMKLSLEEVIDDQSQNVDNHIDLRSMIASTKLLSFAYKRAMQEDYEIPAYIDGSLTTINIRMLHTGETRGKVTAAFESERYGQVNATFVVGDKEKVEGYIVSNHREGLVRLQEKNQELQEKILKESGKNADVNYVFSKSQGAESLTRDDMNATKASTKELYQIAKGFLLTFTN